MHFVCVTVGNMPLVYVCWEPNTVSHALIRNRGGFVIQRHNEIRDTEAELLDEVCHSVEKFTASIWSASQGEHGLPPSSKNRRVSKTELYREITSTPFYAYKIFKGKFYTDRQKNWTHFFSKATLFIKRV